MHELAIMKNVFDLVMVHAEEFQARKVCRVNLSIGALTDIVPSWAQFFFNMLAKDSIADQAEVRIEKIPARIGCLDCNSEFEFDRDHLLFSCSHCQSNNIKLISGREFRLMSIEVE